MGELLGFRRSVNGVDVEQRVSDGFINGTAMCVAHGKNIADWFRNRETIDIILALALDLGVEFKYEISHNSGVKRVSSSLPSLVISKQGSPKNGGGTWLHPDLAIQLAQWCNPAFAIQVSRWVREWLTTGQNPVQSNIDPDIEWAAWQQRYDIRINLKDVLRPELMNSTAAWAQEQGFNPRKLCQAVHDRMNERIQGAKSQPLKLMGGLPLGSLIRDYFEAPDLVRYSAINQIAKNKIVDAGMNPVQAVDEACDVYLGKAYVPKPAKIVESVHAQGRRVKSARRRKRLNEGIQQELNLEVS